MKSRVVCFLQFPKICFLLGCLGLIPETSHGQQASPLIAPQINPVLALPSGCEARALPEYTTSSLRPGGGVVYSLPQLIDLAEKQNPDAKGAWESVQLAAAVAGIAKSQLLPTLALSGYALRGNLLLGLPPNISAESVIKLRSNILEASIQGTYSGDFGTNLNYYRAAKHLLASERASLNETNQKVALDVSTKYYDLLTAKESRHKELANEEDSCLNLKESEEEFRNGLTSIISVRAAKAKYLQAHASTLNAVAKEANAKVGLAALLGTQSNQSFDVAPLADAPPVRLLRENVEALQQHALSTRPKIAQDEQQIEAAHDAVTAARRKYFPTFTLTAQESYTDSMGNTDPGMSTAAQDASTNSKGPTYLYAGSFKFNVFDGGATRNGIKAAKAGERKLRDSAEKTRLQVQEDIAKDYNDILYAIVNQDAAVAAVAAAKDALDSATISKQNGLSSELDLSKARLSYISAQETYVEARTSALKSATQLAYDTGDLLTTGAESPERIEAKP